MTVSHAEIFEAYRSDLMNLAYRMTGSLTDSEDVVQDAWIRWQNTDIASIENGRAFLHKIVTRLCLDLAKSAKAKRELYVGPWLPEPVQDMDVMKSELSPDKQLEFAEDLSLALMITLESLSPLERAAFLLHDVFDYSFDEIASSLDRSPEACRKLASRARGHIKNKRPGNSPDETVLESLVNSFMHTLQTGDTSMFADKLTEDAVLYTDGGGKKIAARNPIYGRLKIARFFTGLASKFGTPRSVEPVYINGEYGLKLIEHDDTISVVSVALDDNQLIREIYIVRNPEKLNWVN